MARVVLDSIRVKHAAAILLMLLMLTIAGAATTVAVAWGVALRRIPISELSAGYDDDSRKPTSVRFTSASEDLLFTFRSPVSGAGWTYLHMQRGTLTGNDTLDPDLSDTTVANRFPIGHPVQLDGPNTRTDIRFGWPSRAMFAYELEDWYFDMGDHYGWTHAYILNPKPGASDITLFMKFDHPSDKGHPLGVPTGILPRGFAINTAFYAALWWIALWGLKLARGQLRAWRGRCRTCAYSLTGLAPGTPCPECGRKRTPSHTAPP